MSDRNSLLDNRLREVLEVLGDKAFKLGVAYEKSMSKEKPIPSIVSRAAGHVDQALDQIKELVKEERLAEVDKLNEWFVLGKTPIEDYIEERVRELERASNVGGSK